MKTGVIGLIARVIGVVFNHLSPSLRAKALMALVYPSAQYDTPERALRFLFDIDKRLYTLQGQIATRYGNGIHTKHRHINYHQFFIKNLKPGDHVLDIGCGNGFLSFDMASQGKNVRVTGIELSEANIEYARQHYQHPHLKFIHGDVLESLPIGNFNVVTLSNILEHLEKRVDFLRRIIKQFGPERVIVRVPQFERDWRVPLKKELGVDYRLDLTHQIEYLQEEFIDELKQAGLRVTQLELRWGEIWAVAEPLDERGEQ